MAWTAGLTAPVPRWMIIGEWRAHPARIVTAILAIAIGVALGFAVHLVNASALDRFARGLATVNGEADLRVQAAGGRGFDENIYPRLARMQGIVAASPVVALSGRLGDRRIDILGVDVLRVAAAAPSLLPRPRTDDGESVFDPGSLFLSDMAMAGHRIGEAVLLVVDGRAERFVIAGTVPGASNRALGIIDIAAAQDRFDRLGRLDRIDLRMGAQTDIATMRTSIAQMLPANALLATTAEDLEKTDGLSRAYRVNLDMLALVALLTGAFLVYSAQALSIARRAPQFALLRVMGASKRSLMGQLVTEGLVLGVLGSSLGILLGLLLAAGVLRLVGGDLGGSYFGAGGAPPLLFAPGAALGFAALGLGSALIGSLVPANQAARVAPAVALRNLGDAADPRQRPRILPALFLAILGIGLALLPAIHGIALFGYAAIGILLAAGILAMPWLARALLSPLKGRSFQNPVVGLAIGRLWGAPSQAAVALSGIVASVGLMIAMAVMVSSFRGSVDEWLDQILVDDVYLSAQGGTPFDAAARSALAAVPGVAGINFGAQHQISLAAGRPPVILVVRDRLISGGPAMGRRLPVPAGLLGVRVSEPAARLYSLAPGSMILLPLGAQRTRAFVTDIYRDYARQEGAIMIGGADYDRITGDTKRGEASIRMDGQAHLDAVLSGLRKAFPPAIRNTVQVVPTRVLKERALAIFDRSFAITYGLELVAVLVGLAGVAATTSAQTLARSREFGMLRHLGVTRQQILAMLGIEGALLGLVGGVAGIGLGCGLAQVLIRVVNPQSFNWTMETRAPVGILLSVGAALVAASAVTAMIAGRRAVSTDALRAVREDW
jgi:putative ABC transport system permease protein